MIYNQPTRKLAVVLLISLGVFACDQVTKDLVKTGLRHGEVKTVAQCCFNLVHVHNTGAAFSLFSDVRSYWGRMAFTLFSLLAVGVVFYYLFATPAGATLQVIALAAILGGAVGNLLDRFRYGYVVDFIHLHYTRFHWHIFNVADIAITVGVALLILRMITPRLARLQPPVPL
ncbi:MAG: signal peptidase II [Nitrospirae bacterium]|nr:signal peptidase II [Nitrospirota bacterium]